MASQENRRWPAEWEPHKATWMAWPCRQSIWINGLETAQRAFAEVANTISESEPVCMLIRKEHLRFAKKILSENVEVFEYPLDDSWARDFSPIWISHEEKAKALRFMFNAWGEKFYPYANDAGVADFIIDKVGDPFSEQNFVLEGGAIHGNGAGTLMTTEECLLNPNRNPAISKQALENRLLEVFGAEKMIWLPQGLYGDEDTDGHVDNIACFIDEHRVLSQRVNHSDSENADIYNNNSGVIKDHGFELIEIHEPEPRYYNGKRLPLSYINFYVANEQIIIPSFGCSQDDEARSLIQELFPKRTVSQVNANEIIIGGGGIHCITMQQPAI
ncbi:agmatine deiminase family protein [Kangiella sediminilitoris]|uniref:Agmatine deiminase n=1 Tax=Kangiella sediminilitoris TaxID=1144748 RepID=A0A1B3BAD8_9GAMM|nr:agmatine deiminase family protein [Kangiella sediminilitoris]AOE49759.1 agmatine deiminase [Kangiella sediminilitoris]